MGRKLYHYRYLFLLVAFIPFGTWVLSGHALAQYETSQSVAAEAPFLSADSHAHWLFAVISAAIFLTVARFLFGGRRVSFAVLVGSMVFTATAGMALLFAVQYVAEESLNETWSGSFSWVLIHFLLNGIAYSYRTAEQDGGSFAILLLGYICGVGLCEETTKLIPLLFRMRDALVKSASEARVIGFVSGAGFGVAEGILYSERSYNGHSTAGIYAIRFLSCVAMHGLSTAVAAGLLFSWNFQKEFDQKITRNLAWRIFGKYSLIIFPAMLLHALYDVFSVKGMFDGALCCELVLMAILAFQIDRESSFDGEPNLA
jgi:RsiW-degrading membrane proteinase PrsW (M82 family)